MNKLIIAIAMTFGLAAGSIHASPKFFTYSPEANTWDTLSNCWGSASGGPYSSTWSDNDDAVFEGTSGAVSVVNTQAANSVTFSTDGYTFTNGTLMLAGSAAITNAVNGRIASLVAGSSGLHKTGSGTLTLTGTNTYTGGTTLSQGALVAGNANALGASTGITVLGDANTGASDIKLICTATLNQGTITVASSGTGSVVIEQATTAPYDAISGRLVLNRATTIQKTSGGSYICYNSGIISGNVGTLTIQNLAAGTIGMRGSGASTFVGTVILPQGGVTLYIAGALGNGNSVVMSGTASLTLWASQTFGALTGGASNPINMYGQAASPGNNILTISNAVSTTFAGVLSDPGGSKYGSLTKTGTGTQTLSGVNTYRGQTSINGGMLVINGSLAAASPVAVNSGGTLGGTGTVFGGVTAASGGTVAPGDPAVGNGVGILTVSNTVTLASNATFAVQLSTGGSDRVVSSSTVTNLGATLSVSVLDGGVTPGMNFVVLSATNLMGTFDGLPEGGSIKFGGRRYIVSYPGNTNVVIHAAETGTLLVVQ